MSDVVVVGILTCAVTLIGIFVSANSTRSAMTQELDKRNALQQQEIEHIKESIVEMKEDIKSHNNYARLFAETMPVVQEQIKNINSRLEDRK